MPLAPGRKEYVLSASPLLIGTRGSPLALWQAEHVRDLLRESLGPGAPEIALQPITTSGDRIQDQPLRELGGKGLFTKEIDAALLRGDVALAVHSMKDLPTELPEGIVIGAVLPRHEVRDAFISNEAASLADLPPGAVVGTASLRRQAQVRKLRPDLRVTDFRGNVETRIRKLAEGAANATLLSMAGLDRLGLAYRATCVLATDEMLPAVAQGAIGISCRADDPETLAILLPLNDPASATSVACERAFLTRLDGSCRTPIAGLAEIENGSLHFRGMILTPDGSEWHEIALTGRVEDAVRIGTEAGDDLLARAGPNFLAKLA
jgi:hydroxymethylbilane synthase